MTISLVKCTVQRCHGQESTRAIAAFSPSCWSEIASRTPDRPRRLSERRNSTQNAPDSTSPMSRPITSRTPDSCTAYATTMALETTRPWSLTLTVFASSHRYG